MSQDSRSTNVPKLNPGCDVRTLPLGPSEAYLLSRIDGSVTVAELGMMTGFDEAQVTEHLIRLADLGAISWNSGRRPVTPPPITAQGNQVAAAALIGMERAAVETHSSASLEEEGPKSRALYDPSELDEEVDIPQEKRRKILDAFHRLEEMNHYEVLGVSADVDKKAIKNAYYGLAAEYHPDKFFRKSLGNYKAKMEAIFGRITLAHDTLSKKQLREEYDAYLQTQRANRSIEEILREGESQADKELAELRRTVMGETIAQTQALETAAAAEKAQQLAGRVEEPARSSVRPGSYETVTQRNPEADKARREAFARRLSGGRISGMPSSAPPGSTSSVPPRSTGSGPSVPASPRPVTPSVPAARNSLPPAAAAEDLRRRYEERQVQAKRMQIAKYLEAAESASKRNDPASAANAYRLAVALDPTDLTVQEALKMAQIKASTLLADGYLKQAEYEERTERWADAARSYLKVIVGAPDNARVHDRAANALMKAGTDLHKAASLAKRAVEINPNAARYRVTLGQVYLAAGLQLNARRELEAAASLAPDDASIAQLLVHLRKS